MGGWWFLIYWLADEGVLVEDFDKSVCQNVNIFLLWLSHKPLVAGVNISIRVHYLYVPAWSLIFSQRQVASLEFDLLAMVFNFLTLSERGFVVFFNFLTNADGGGWMGKNLQIYWCNTWTVRWSVLCYHTLAGYMQTNKQTGDTIVWTIWWKNCLNSQVGVREKLSFVTNKNESWQLFFGECLNRSTLYHITQMQIQIKKIHIF